MIWGNMFSRWPYTDLQNLNLDWLIGVCKDITTNWPPKLEELENEVNKKLDKALNEGTLGDILTNNGNGTYSWKTFDNAIGNQIVQAVNNWLVAHPEATTTVQDGAISASKLDTELYKLYKESGQTQFFFPKITGSETQGTCVMMVTPSKTVLFDTHAQDNETEVFAYFDELYNNGIFTNIDYIVISHMHGDHIGLLEEFIENYPHNNLKVFLPLSPSGYNAGTENPILIYDYDRIVAYLQTNIIDYQIISQDTTITIDEHTSMNLINSSAPAYTYYSNNGASYNNYSMVAIVKNGKLNNMFPGDIESVAEQRLMGLYDLPRVFIYAVHHHGVENTEYEPFAYKIDPVFNVCTISYDRSPNTQKGTFIKLSSGQICNTGYDDYSFCVDGVSGYITHGLLVPNSGYLDSYITLYVNNSTTETIHNGTFAYPFKSIEEATLFIKRNRTLKYEIVVIKTETPYTIERIRGIEYPITIRGIDSNPAEIGALMIENCARVSLNNLTINGSGISDYISNSKVLMIIANSYVELLNGFTIDGTNVTGDITGLALQNTKLRLSYATFTNLTQLHASYGLDSMEYIKTSYCTYSNITNVFNQRNTQVQICDGNNFTNIGEYVIKGEIARNMPAIIAGWFLNNTFASQCNAQAVSYPGYVSASHPCVMISNSKAYDLLTGNEVT